MRHGRAAAGRHVQAVPADLVGAWADPLCCAAPTPRTCAHALVNVPSQVPAQFAASVPEWANLAFSSLQVHAMVMAGAMQGAGRVWCSLV